MGLPSWYMLFEVHSKKRNDSHGPDQFGNVCHHVVELLMDEVILATRYPVRSYFKYDSHVNWKYVPSCLANPCDSVTNE